MTVVRTGRTQRCETCRSTGFCASCRQRIRYGDPSPQDSWAARLSLTEDQMNLLLIGAAEFDELHRMYVRRATERGLPIPETPSAVDFMDWVSPSIVPPQAYEADGGKPSKEVHGAVGGGLASTRHRHPFPLPYVERRSA